jgi:two-component system response regulator PhcR
MDIGQKILPSEQMPAGAAGARPAILYVDDEPQSLKYFLRAFSGDFQIFTAQSVADAETLLAAESERIGVLISDQRMPVETGVQLLDRVKARYPQIVRVLTTAYADLNDAVAAVNRGEIHRYILKPWDMEALRAELHAATELYQRRCHEQELLQARRRTIMSLASHIAHELSTPLATIHTAVSSMKEYLPELLKTYRRERERGMTDVIPESLLDLLETTPGMVLSLVDRTNMLTRLLLMNAAEDAEDRSDFVVFSVRKCLDEALSSYPFSAGDETLVRVEGDDFEVKGSELLFSYVLYNLIKNALYAIDMAGKGDISLRLGPGSRHHRLYIRDTGTGISPQVLPHVFDEFYSGKGPGRGTGMGLPFCRRVMTAFGGSIECRSSDGEYTELELIFPTLDQPQG